MKTRVIDGIECAALTEDSGLNGDRAISFRPLTKRKETVVIDGVEYPLKSHTIRHDGVEYIMYVDLKQEDK